MKDTTHWDFRCLECLESLALLSKAGCIDCLNSTDLQGLGLILPTYLPALFFWYGAWLLSSSLTLFKQSCRWPSEAWDKGMGPQKDRDAPGFKAIVWMNALWDCSAVLDKYLIRVLGKFEISGLTEEVTLFVIPSDHPPGQVSFQKPMCTASKHWVWDSAQPWRAKWAQIRSSCWEAWPLSWPPSWDPWSFSGLSWALHIPPCGHTSLEL